MQKEREKKQQIADLKKEIRCLYALVLNARHIGVDVPEIERQMADLQWKFESLCPNEDVWPSNRSGDIEARTQWVWSYIADDYVKQHGYKPERRDAGASTWYYNRQIAPFAWVANGLVVDKEDFVFLKNRSAESEKVRFAK